MQVADMTGIQKQHKDKIRGKAKAYSDGVSVVIGAYQDGEALIATVKSILEQLNEPLNENLLLEVVIVDDGGDTSIKQALQNLKDIVDDSIAQLNIIQQKNVGLTKSLIEGCLMASYEYIARIDVGDIMLKGRLAEQIQLLNSDKELVAVASWANIVTQEGYALYNIEHSNEQIAEFLCQTEFDDEKWDSFTSPQHYTMMFRHSVYDLAGAYRSQFYYAQDVDLWLRLSEFGRIHLIEKVLTQAVFSANSISGSNNSSQEALSRLAYRAAIVRRQGQMDDSKVSKNKVGDGQVSEGLILEQAKRIRPKNKPHRRSQLTQKQASFKSLYFIAKCLLDNKHYGARGYFKSALNTKPLALKAWLGLFRSMLLTANHASK